MSISDLDRAPVEAQAEEQTLITGIEGFLARQHECIAKLAGPDGEQIEIPASVYEVLRRAVRILARSDKVLVAPIHQLLTTFEAADFLNISRPYLVHLLERGEIPFTRVGTHRRIRFDDLMDYKRSRDDRRSTALDQLAQMSEELGLYDQE